MSVFIFILTILPGNTLSSNLLPIVQPAPELNGTYNKPVSFNCTIPSTWISTKFMIKGEHGYKFSVFNGHPCEVPLRVRDNYTISCHGNTLTIGILQPVDKTTWQCAYNINPTEEYNASTTLNLQPEIPSVTLQDTYVITEGSDVTVPCAFIGAPISNVTWQRENHIIQWSKNENHVFNLVLKNVSRNLAGNYTCSVTVDFKGIYTDSKTITLVVKYPPTLMPNNEIAVKEYTPKVSIPCRILEDGFPRNYTTVLWQHFVGNTLIRNLTPTDPPPDEINSTFTLVLKSVSFDDSGSYVCAIGNGVTDFEGDLEQTTCVDLVVQGTPKVLRMKDGYHGEIGKQFSIIFRCVGQPVVPTLKINTHNEDTGPMFNISTTRDLVEIAIYGTLLSTNGTIVTMTFGVIKDWFNTTYELIAENSVGVSNHSFFVDSHDFPRTPYHIHFKKFESTALLEWEAGMPDVDKQYEIIVKNISGIMKELYRIQGTDSQVYQYRLTNLVQPSNIIQICTLNHLGRNCSTTFKIKMDTKTGIISQIEANQTPTSLLLPLSIGLAALLGVFVVCLIIILRRRKSFSPLKRRDTPFRRNSNEVQRLTLGQENEESFIREASADNTYITPQCMNSRTGLSPSCQSNAECDAYASVDDIGISKLSQPQGQDFGNSQHAGNIKPKTVMSENSTKGPTLPERATQASQLRYSGMNGHVQGLGATSIDLPSSPPLFNGSATTCEPNTAISILDVTTGAQGGTENENGGYCEIKHKSNVKYSKKWCENGSHIKKM